MLGKEPPFEKLIQPRNRKLLGALLDIEKFDYERLAGESGRSAAALRVQFHRWESLGLALLQQIGTVPDDGPGRNRRVFRLNPLFRGDVERALEEIASHTQLPERDTLPDLRSSEAALLGAMSSAELDLSEGYYIAQQTLSRLRRVRETISTQKPEALGFRISDTLRENLIGQMASAEMLLTSVRMQISEKPDEINEREDRAVWYADHNAEKGPERMAPYFAEIPDRSVSGFGGMLSARKIHPACNAIDDFLTPALPDFLPGGRLRSGFVHVLKEAIELEKIDSNWSNIVDRLWDGADRCTPIRDLPELAQMQKSIEDRSQLDGLVVLDGRDSTASGSADDCGMPEDVAKDIAELKKMPEFRMPESRRRFLEEAYKTPWKQLLADVLPPDFSAAFAL